MSIELDETGRKRLVLPERFRRGGPGQRDKSSVEDSGLELLQLVQSRLGLEALSGLDMLDVGCGNRFGQTILYHDLPIGHYVGIDVFADLIEFLQTHAIDERLEFHHIDVYNRLYNKRGKSLTLDFELPVGNQRFDVICLFSVFTHMDPRDSDCMLSLLRPYMKPGGKMIFSCFIDENVSGFDDARPDQPLLWALYTRGLMEHLTRRNGWRILDFHPPQKSDSDYWLIQHHYVCEPV